MASCVEYGSEFSGSVNGSKFLVSCAAIGFSVSTGPSWSLIPEVVCVGWMVVLACHIVFIRLITVTILLGNRGVCHLLCWGNLFPIIGWLSEKKEIRCLETCVRFEATLETVTYNASLSYIIISFVLRRAVLFYPSCSSYLCLRPPSGPSCMPVVLLRKRWRAVSSPLSTFLHCLNCTPYYVRHKLIDGGDPVAMVTGEASSAACVDFRFLVPCWLGDGC